MGHRYAGLIEASCGQHALRFSDSPTGKCLSIISGEDAERTMLTDLGASIGLSELGEFRSALVDTQVAHFTGYTLLGGPTRPLVQEAMATAHASGAKVSLDAADPFVVVQVKSLLEAALDKYVHIVFLNAEEALGLTGLPAEDAAAAIGGRGVVETVVVKLGAEGSIVWHRGEIMRVPVKPVDAIDTTGAGDAYAGGFLFGVTRGWSPAQCGALATRVAGLTVAQVGAVVKDREALSNALVEVGAAPLAPSS
jgi:hypothetical protein